MMWHWPTPEQSVWLLTALIGLVMSLGIGRVALRNYDREAVEKTTRFIIAQAHLRRVSFRIVRLTINVLLGLVALTAGQPQIHSVVVAYEIIVLGLILAAIIDTVDVALDYRLIRALFAV